MSYSVTTSGSFLKSVLKNNQKPIYKNIPDCRNCLYYRKEKTDKDRFSESKCVLFRNFDTLEYYNTVDARLKQELCGLDAFFFEQK